MTAKDLKNALLQEAVQGKLVPQIASEGNAKDLLEEIRKEKAKLVKEGKLKKEKPLPEITEEDIPFDIPENWCWCRLGDCVNVQSSKRVFEKDYVKSGIPFYRSKEIGELSKGKPINTELFITNDHYKKLKETVGLPQKGDILLCSIGGSIGNTWINDGRDFYYKDGNVTQICNNKFMDTVFINYYLHSELFAKQVKSEVAGSAYNALTIIKIKNLLFPLPPLAEQKRIVAAIEKFMPLIEEYGKKETQLKAFNEKIGTLTKKAILQEAVQGKLVPQIASEGNAKDLLEEIKKEKAKLIKEGKIKKEKPLPEISDDEIPFDIPESWCWCRLSDFCNLYTGNSINETEKKTKYTNLKEGRFYIGTKDIGFDSVINYDNGVRIPFENANFRIADTNTILMCIEGGSAGRKIAFTNQPVCFGNKLCCFNSYKNEIEKFIFYFLQSTLFTDAFKDNINGIIGGVSINNLKGMLFPLPPLAEQKRIVNVIEKMLPLCEKLGE